MNTSQNNETVHSILKQTAKTWRSLFSVLLSPVVVIVMQKQQSAIPSSWTTPIIFVALITLFSTYPFIRKYQSIKNKLITSGLMDVTLAHNLRHHMVLGTMIPTVVIGCSSVTSFMATKSWPLAIFILLLPLPILYAYKPPKTVD